MIIASEPFDLQTCKPCSIWCLISVVRLAFELLMTLNLDLSRNVRRLRSALEKRYGLRLRALVQLDDLSLFWNEILNPHKVFG